MGWLSTLFGTESRKKDRSTAIVMQNNERPVRDYDNAFKTDRTIGRQLYHNINKNYLLAAQFVKPIVNNNVNFIGKPELFGNKRALKVIEEVKIDYRTVHKSLETDGDVFVWPQWDQKRGKIKLVYVPIDAVSEIFVDPVTKEETGYRFEELVYYNTPKDGQQHVTIVYIITADVVIRQMTGSINKIESMRNPFGFVPIVHFHNDRDLLDLYGHAEIENIEPQLKFYHELTYEAGAAQSRDGHPKLKVKTDNPKQWIDNNFGQGTYEKAMCGELQLNLEGRDLFVNNADEDVSYLFLNKTTGDYSNLAEYTFTNIVEGSETPEINFGANIGTSLASVKEYRPVWIKKIEAKQEEREQPWLDVYDIIINIHNFVKLTSVKNDITIQWPKPNFVSVKEQSEIVEAFAKAIEKLKAKGVVTNEEIYNTLVKLDIFDMFKTYKEHEEVIKNETIEQEDENGSSSAEKDTDEGADSGTEGDTDDDSGATED